MKECDWLSKTSKKPILLDNLFMLSLILKILMMSMSKLLLQFGQQIPVIWLIVPLPNK